MKPVKRQANRVLAAAAGLFAGALALKYHYPGNELAAALLTISEASLAGGVADWFAVTALFRRPLGFPYHTALVPRNRERIIEALTRTIEQDFFNKQSIADRIHQVNILDKLTAYAGTRISKAGVRTVLDTLLAELAQTIDPGAVGKYGERLLKVILRRQSAAPQAAALLRWTLQEEKGGELYTAVVNELAVRCAQEGTREAIYNYLEQLKQNTAQKNWLASLVTGVLEGMDGINLEDAATALHEELIRTVDELAGPEHPVRQWFQEELKEVSVNLETPEWAAIIDDWKNGQLARASFAGPLTAVVQAILEAFKRPSAYRDSVADWLAGQLASYWQQVKESTLLQHRAETYLKTLLTDIFNKEHSLVGQVAGSALRKLSDEELNQFIEDKAGEDLDWIRINGVFVGGIAGLVLAVVQWLV